jgi:LCP family protein required for cell wall assembly
MDERRVWLRAFAGRFGIALVVGSLLMAGAVAGVDREIGRKIDRIPKIRLATAPLPPEGANYLVVGSDTREFVANELEREAFGDATSEGGRRSDTIMVLHVEPRAQRTLVVSIPRDLWVNIPGHGYSKINAAYNYGPQTLIDTLKANFDIDINHYIELNFISFVGLVNTLGTVPVYVPYEARDSYTGFGLPNGGCWPLDGELSLAWVRSRYLEYRDPRSGRWVPADIVPDIGRIGRQQDFMRRLAAIAVTKSLANPLTANSVADEVIRNMKVDDAFDRRAIFALIDAFRTLNPDDTSALNFQTMPWKTGPRQGGQDVLYADMAAAAPLVERLRTFDTRPRPAPDPATIRVRIVNASGRAGLGLAAQRRFEELGFVVTEVLEHPSGRSDDNVVRYATGQLDKAKLLLRYVEPIAALSLGDAVVPNADVEVILGRSFTGIQVPADRLEVTTALPGDTVIEQPLEQPLELPQPPPSVELPNPAPRGNC